MRIVNKYKLGALALVSCSFLMAQIIFAGDLSTSLPHQDVIAKKQTESALYLTAAQAYKLVKKGDKDVLFIDVRTPAEVEFVGWTPLVDAVIPYMSNDYDEWNEKKHRYLKVINGGFPIVFEDLVVEKGLNKNSLIIFICRSGTRSGKAATLANKLGYTRAYTVVDGFEGDKAKEGEDKGHRTVNGWKNSGLPWDYKVDGQKILFNQ